MTPSSELEAGLKLIVAWFDCSTLQPSGPRQRPESCGGVTVSGPGGAVGPVLGVDAEVFGSVVPLEVYIFGRKNFRQIFFDMKSA